jgi:DNA-binding HxlR family transcriptional regulator
LAEVKRSRMICLPSMLHCPLEEQFGVLSRKWTLLILRDIGFRGIGRFTALNKSIGNVTPRILSIRLRQLKAAGLIKKERDHTSGKTAIWQLTEKGTDLIPMLLEWVAFRSKWDAGRLFRNE